MENAEAKELAAVPWVMIEIIGPRAQVVRHGLRTATRRNDAYPLVKSGSRISST